MGESGPIYPEQQPTEAELDEIHRWALGLLYALNVLKAESDCTHDHRLPNDEAAWRLQESFSILIYLMNNRPRYFPSESLALTNAIPPRLKQHAGVSEQNYHAVVHDLGTLVLSEGTGKRLERGKCEKAYIDISRRITPDNAHNVFREVREKLGELETDVLYASLRMEHANAIESVRAAEPKEKENPLPPGCAHSDDYRSVTWFGTGYTFSANQAAIVKVLWQHWKRSTPDVGGETLMQAADIAGDRFDLVFRDNEAWRTMIVQGRTKGTYRLQRPADGA